MTIPPPGKELLRLFRAAGGLGGSVSWRESPIVASEIQQAAGERAWPWNLLREFDPPPFAPDEFDDLHSRRPGVPGPPLRPLKALESAFARDVLGLTTSWVEEHYVASAGRNLIRIGRGYWTEFGAWPWAAVPRGSFLEKWWTDPRVRRGFLTAVTRAGLLNHVVAYRFKSEARDALCEAVGLPGYAAEAESELAEARRAHRTNILKQRGLHDVPEEWRPPLIYSMPSPPRTTGEAINLFAALVFKTTGAAEL
jgi:hypothetical protein